MQAEYHSTDITVRGYHLDVYQHVNNARYLEFLEEARWAYFGDSIHSDYFAKNKLAFIVVNININYRYPATLGHILEVRTSLKDIGKKSVTVLQEIYLKNSDTLVVSADVVFALLDQKVGRAVAISDELLEVLNLERTT
ncbi:MAG: acyl-CoA thioesterase [Bernardetiaceae bacterium]|nr:acyl-CoA thioesterase [Bernardetiaceae bacterium]